MTKTGINKKILLLAVILFSTAYNAAGTEEIRRLIAGGGATWHNIRDEGISPSLFSGRHSSFFTGISKSKQAYVSHLDISLYRGQLHPGHYPELTDATMKTSVVNFNYTYMRRLKTSGGNNISLSAGGSVNNSYFYHRHLLFDNSSVNSSFYTKISLAAMGSYPFTWEGKDLIMNFKLSVPVLSLNIRPSYAMSKPIGFLYYPDNNFKALFNSIDVATLNSFMGLNSSLWLEYRLSYRYGLKFSYEWNFFAFNGDNNVKSGTNTFMIHTFLDF